MLREAVNLSPDGKALTPDAALSHPADSADSDSEDLPQHPSTSRHSSAHPSVTADGKCTVSQQGQEVGAGAAVLREAYKEMLLQQQARHRAELDKRQAKYQRQLDAQVRACRQNAQFTAVCCVHLWCGTETGNCRQASQHVQSLATSSLNTPKAREGPLVCVTLALLCACTMSLCKCECSTL